MCIKVLKKEISVFNLIHLCLLCLLHVEWMTNQSVSQYAIHIYANEQVGGANDDVICCGLYRRHT